MRKFAPLLFAIDVCGMELDFFVRGVRRPIHYYGVGVVAMLVLSG